jgi:hypothetical protein
MRSPIVSAAHVEPFLSICHRSSARATVRKQLCYSAACGTGRRRLPTQAMALQLLF